jgi:DNA-binding response OmpR family regulator
MRILVVEDEKKIADAIKSALESKAYAVDVTYDGASGRDMALTQEYDLMIIDRMLPGIKDGLQIVDKVRDSGIKTPVLVLTARNTVKDRVDGLDSGADDYLMKPFALVEFMARVRALLRRNKEIVTNNITYDGLSVDTELFEVSRDGVSIPLSRKEFALLEYFIRNVEKVLSKKSIIEHVWDWESDILPNTLEVYIGYLRTKIDKPFPNKPPLIRTVRGFGYKLSNTK